MEDFGHYLKTNYPTLFKQKPIELWCPTGWQPLVTTLCKYLIAIKADISIIQIKEKFGTLRFYYQLNAKSPVNKAELELESHIAAVVQFAEYCSGTICQNDGNPGTKHDSGWLKTLCTKCKEIENESI